MGKKNKDEKDPCGRLLTREERLHKWGLIYDKALGVIAKNLGLGGSGKDIIYAACQSIQTASREIQIIERVMTILGEIKAGNSALGYEVTPHDDEIEALFLASMQRQKENEINA